MDKKTSSEIFALHTANTSSQPTLEENVVIITSNGDILLSDVKKQDPNAKSPIALLTTDSTYEFTYKLKKPFGLKSINAVVRNKVLGINTFVPAQGPNTLTIPMLEKQPLLYVAALKTYMPGDFDIFVRIIDTNGNITEQKIAEIKVLSHLTVYDRETKQPLTDARVFLHFRNPKTKSYEPLSRELFKTMRNPSYTNSKGEIMGNLPPGAYRATTSTFGYDESTVNFVLGSNTGEEFPQVFLQKNLANPMNFIRYYQNSVIDFLSNFTKFLNSLSLSLRFFNLIAFVVVASFVFISFLLFTMRTHIRFTHIPSFFFHHIEKLFKKTSPVYIAGSVIDENKQPLTRAHVECIDAHTGKVLAHVETNKVGKFYLRNFKDRSLKLITTRDNYLQSLLLLQPNTEQMRTEIRITMQSEEKQKSTLFGVFIEQMENIAGMFFEFVLVFTVIIECFFLSLFTFTSTLPFFVLSLFNVLLWIFFIRERFEQKFAK